MLNTALAIKEQLGIIALQESVTANLIGLAAPYPPPRLDGGRGGGQGRDRAGDGGDGLLF